MSLVAVGGKGVLLVRREDKTLVGLDDKTGKELWTRPDTPDISGAFNDGASAYLNVDVEGGQLWAVDPVSGKSRWRAKVHFTDLHPLAQDGFVFGVTDNNDRYALDAKTGKTLWKKHNDVGWLGEQNRLVSGTLYTGTEDDHILAVDARTGKVKWDPVRDDGLSDVPVVARKFAYFGCTTL